MESTTTQKKPRAATRLSSVSIKRKAAPKTRVTSRALRVIDLAVHRMLRDVNRKSVEMVLDSACLTLGADTYSAAAMTIPYVSRVIGGSAMCKLPAKRRHKTKKTEKVEAEAVAVAE